ncbi:MAG: hypothetical protein FWH29_00960 [Methanobrevibacter sp.]|nr:hypothetical protein [Methanobrevibacter sp.]
MPNFICYKCLSKIIAKKTNFIVTNNTPGNGCIFSVAIVTFMVKVII